MAQTLTAKARADIVAMLLGDIDFGDQKYELDRQQKDIIFTNGAGATDNVADTIFVDRRQLAASASENLDLAGSGLTNPLTGATLTFARVKALLIKALDTNVNDIVIGNAATNGFISPFGGATHTVTLRPGGAFMLIAPKGAGYTVTAGTADQLKILNNAGSTPVDYDIVIIGAST